MRIAFICGSFLLGACSQSAPGGDSGMGPASDESNEFASAAEMQDENQPASANEGEDGGSETTGLGACRMQGGQEIAANRLKGVGTEPFWAVTTSGRCVTYTTPENQEGTRLWTTFTGSRDAGKWTGFLGKERFVMETRPEVACSDGMSDRKYPVAVTLTIGSDRRRGCAAPA